jgi:superfamily I DNA and RNA helicase
MSAPANHLVGARESQQIHETQHFSGRALSKLRVVHRDLSPQEKERLERKLVQATDLAEALERGELNPEDLDEETRIKLLRLLGAVK